MFYCIRIVKLLEFEKFYFFKTFKIMVLFLFFFDIDYLKKEEE